MDEDLIDLPLLLVDEDYRLECRARMQTDLLWLAKYALGYDLLDEDDHREAANVFVQKDPSKPFEEQSPVVRRRMLVLPRKTFKSTLSIADAVQWVIDFPDIAIMVMTAGNSADSPLADAFVAECASHFYCPEGTPRKALHICFPEHRIKRMPAKGIFKTPARRKYRRDPTIHGVSIEYSLSGWHPDIIKSEDVQDNRNSQTVYALKKVRKNFYINLKMLGETGLLDVTCTRYGPADLYGDMIQKAGPETKILWKPAYIRKPHAVRLEEDELVEEDVVLQFPRQLSWNFLMAELRLDPETFYTQYLNIAEGNFVPTFPIEKLEAAKVANEDNEGQGHGTIHISWRFELGDSKYAACAVGIEREGRMTIVEVRRGQFTPTALARHVVGMAKGWETHRVMIEDTPGAYSMLQHIENEALEESWRVDIIWMGFPREPTERTLFIKAAEPHLLSGRLLFDDACRNLGETHRQLYHFGMVEDTDVATVVARLVSQLPQSIAAKNFAANDEQAFNEFIERDAYDRTYNRGRYYHAAQEPPAIEIEEEYSPQNNGSDYMPGLSG